MKSYLDSLYKYKTILKISTFNGLFMGIIKIAMAIISKSVSLFISSFYNLGISSARGTILRKSKNKINIGLIVIISSIFYVLYSYHTYKYGNKSNYNMYIAILIATITFTDIVLAIIGIKRANKRNDKEDKNIKLISLATSLISLSLTQTAILSFTMKNIDMSKYNGISGMIFGCIAILVGFIILYKNKKI